MTNVYRYEGARTKLPQAREESADRHEKSFSCSKIRHVATIYFLNFKKTNFLYWC